MKKGILLLILLFLVGCSSASQIRATNRKNIVKLYRGMSRQSALFVMGNKQHYTELDEKKGLFQKKPVKPIYINNPYKTEILRGKEKDKNGEKEKIFEVLYYYTEKKRNDGKITDDELTPLVFEEGRLMGWGWSFLETTKKEYHIKK